MTTRGTGKKVSGWYARPVRTEKDEAADREAANKWYEERMRLNYRSLPVEVPGKVLLELGKMAQAKGVPFADFVEGILVEYLQKKGIHCEVAPR